MYEWGKLYSNNDRVKTTSSKSKVYESKFLRDAYGSKSGTLERSRRVYYIEQLNETKARRQRGGRVL